MRKSHPAYILLILAALFTTPFLLAWYCYHHQPPFFTSRVSTNHGILIHPLLTLSQLGITLPPDSPAKGRWLLVYFNPDLCDATCQKNVYEIRQIRQASGKNQDRIQGIILSREDLPPNNPLFHTLQLPYYEGIHYWVVTSGASKLQQNTRYIIDPHGNVVMYYPPYATAKDVLVDLNHLLEVSQIG